MIQVTIGTNTNRTKVSVNPEATLRSVLDANEVNFSVGNIHLDGCSLKPGDLDKTFTQLGVTVACYLIVVVKADNA